MDHENVFLRGLFCDLGSMDHQWFRTLWHKYFRWEKLIQFCTHIKILSHLLLFYKWARQNRKKNETVRGGLVKQTDITLCLIFLGSLLDDKRIHHRLSTLQKGAEFYRFDISRQNSDTSPLLFLFYFSVCIRFMYVSECIQVLEPGVEWREWILSGGMEQIWKKERCWQSDRTSAVSRLYSKVLWLPNVKRSRFKGLMLSGKFDKEEPCFWMREK